MDIPQETIRCPRILNTQSPLQSPGQEF